MTKAMDAVGKLPTGKVLGQKKHPAQCPATRALCKCDVTDHFLELCVANGFLHVDPNTGSLISKKSRHRRHLLEVSRRLLKNFDDKNVEFSEHNPHCTRSRFQLQLVAARNRVKRSRAKCPNLLSVCERAVRLAIGHCVLLKTVARPGDTREIGSRVWTSTLTPIVDLMEHISGERWETPHRNSVAERSLNEYLDRAQKKMRRGAKQLSAA